MMNGGIEKEKSMRKFVLILSLVLSFRVFAEGVP